MSKNKTILNQVEFKAVVKELAEQYDSAISHSEEGSSVKGKSTDKGSESGGVQRLSTLTDAEWERMWEQNGVGVS